MQQLQRQGSSVRQLVLLLHALPARWDQPRAIRLPGTQEILQTITGTFTQGETPPSKVAVPFSSFGSLLTLHNEDKIQQQDGFTRLVSLQCPYL